MNSCKFTAFGLRVKTELLRRGMSQRQLEEEITKNTGLNCDNGYMYKILTGQRAAPRIVKAIREILNIPETTTE
ncbi:MAG: XRE family transcriptional regulator [Oscillospiraceae bacterium]|nr:XRE family transcriptional regulator [Oscillospiraceae bacterium]